ncbi:MAG: outer membrane beta-barrel protein [Ferruginibacter sp.]
MKYLYTVLFIVLISTGSYGQTKFAISGGYNHNSARILKNNDKQTTGDVPGFNLGVRMETEFEPPLHFTAFLGYNTRGYTYQALPDSSVETRIHYIDLAPTFSFNFKTTESSHLNLFAGPLLGIAFSGKQTTKVNGTSSSSDMKFSFSGSYGYANLAIHAGLGYHFRQFFVEGSYHLGLNSINNEEETDHTNIKLRGFSVNLGYWLR